MSERQFQILATISENGRMEVAKPAKLLDVSQVTIRKDLDILEGKRLIRRQQGFAELDSEDDITSRLIYHYKGGLAIVEAAVSQVKNGEVVMIESGSCCALPAEQIVKKLKDVMVITNSVYIVKHTRPALGNYVILLDGEIQMEPMMTVGPTMVQATSNSYADKFYTGADGPTSNGYFTGGDIMRVETIRTMSKRAKKTVVLTESKKLTAHGVIVLLPCKEVYAFYTDDKILAKAKAYPRQSGANVYVVNTDSK